MLDLQNLFTKFALLGAAWVLWVLVILSLLSVAIMVERGLVYRKLRTDVPQLIERLRGFLRRGDAKGAVGYLEQVPGVEAAVARAGLREVDRGVSTVEETMIGVRKRERLGLEKYLSYLGTVGNNAPFIGLFGTVLGIIKAFDKLGGAKNININVVMADISEALVATGVGILVAIPAVAAYNAFNRQVRKMMSNSESVEHIVLAQLKGEAVPEDAGASGSGEQKRDKAKSADSDEPA